MKKGTASDLISIEMALADNRKWADLGMLDRAAEEGLEKQERKVTVTKTEPGTPATVSRPVTQSQMVQGDLFETEIIDVGMR